MSGLRSRGVAIDDLESARHQLLAFNIREAAHPPTVFLHQLRPRGLALSLGRRRFLCLHAGNMAGVNSGVNLLGALEGMMGRMARYPRAFQVQGSMLDAGCYPFGCTSDL